MAWLGLKHMAAASCPAGRTTRLSLHVAVPWGSLDVVASAARGRRAVHGGCHAGLLHHRHRLLSDPGGLPWGWPGRELRGRRGGGGGGRRERHDRAGDRKDGKVGAEISQRSKLHGGQWRERHDPRKGFRRWRGGQLNGGANGWGGAGRDGGRAARRPAIRSAHHGLRWMDEITQDPVRLCCRRAAFTCGRCRITRG